VSIYWSDLAHHLLAKNTKTSTRGCLGFRALAGFWVKPCFLKGSGCLEPSPGKGLGTCCVMQMDFSCRLCRELQDLLALWLVCSQGRAWSPAFLQGLLTYFLHKTKYTKSPHGTEWNSGLCPLPPEHIWEPFLHRAEQLHSKRGREGGRETPMLCHQGKWGLKRQLNYGMLWWVAQPWGSSVGQGQDCRRYSLGWVTGRDDFPDFRLSN